MAASAPWQWQSPARGGAAERVAIYFSEINGQFRLGAITQPPKR
jgi:hypothetical protein